MTLVSRATLKLQEKANHLNDLFRGLHATQILDRVINGRVAGRIAAFSSFGAEAAVLLKLVADRDAATPIVFLDTRKHFDETLTYVNDLMEQLGLTTLVRTRPSPAHLRVEDHDGFLHKSDSDRCCYVRKTLPMIGALRNFDAVLTGRKRFQTEERKAMAYVEIQENWLRINPLADWSRENINEFLDRHGMLQHPLVAQGFPSIGCQPCTAKSDDYRSGRWAEQDKTECGIHITKDGRIARVGEDPPLQ